jgi:hypothetical protein
VPNTYLKPQQYIQLTLAEQYRQSRLQGIITPFSGENFVGSLNDTLIYKTKPVTIARDYEFRVRTRPIVFDEIYRNQLPLTIDQHMTVGNRWTDEERKFDLQNMRREIAEPMGEAMATRFDSKILARLLSADWAVTNLNINAANYPGDTGALKAAMEIKAKLDKVGTPGPNGRYLILGANAFLWFITSKAIQLYDPAQALTVFRQGVFGRIAGFDVVDGTQLVDENAIIALHPSWAVLSTAAPENPESLKFSERATVRGISARLAAQYDMDYASDRLLLNTFWGVNEIKDQFQRHTAQTAAAANDGSEAGDVIVQDGRTLFTNKNVRGGRGTFTPAA